MQFTDDIYTRNTRRWLYTYGFLWCIEV